jgi:hypothetical protein
MDADDRALLDLMDFIKINEVHKKFVDYFSAGDYPNMKTACDRGAKMAADLLSQALALHPNPPLEPLKEAYCNYLRDAKNVFEQYGAAAQAFQQGQESIGVSFAKQGNANVQIMNVHTTKLTELFNNLQKG